MARRASYSYERSQRDRAKIEKREAKKAARAARKDGTAPLTDPEATFDGDLSDPAIDLDREATDAPDAPDAPTPVDAPQQ